MWGPAGCHSGSGRRPRLGQRQQLRICTVAPRLKVLRDSAEGTPLSTGAPAYTTRVHVLPLGSLDL